MCIVGDNNHYKDKDNNNDNILIVYICVYICMEGIENKMYVNEQVWLCAMLCYECWYKGRRKLPSSSLLLCCWMG